MTQTSCPTIPVTPESPEPPAPRATQGDGPADTARRRVLFGLGASPLALGAGGATAAFLATPSLSQGSVAQGSLNQGWDPGVAGPTQADIYVAPDGDDSAPGSLEAPVRSVQRGVDLLARRQGGSLAIRGGTYRETVSLDALRGTKARPYLIHRYGRERVTISAAEQLRNWRPATDDETRRLRLPRGVFVTRIPAAHVRHGSHLALNIYENGRPCAIAMDRTDRRDPLTMGQVSTYREGDFIYDADDRVLAIRDTRLIGQSAEVLDGAQIRLYRRPNRLSSVDIASFDPATGTIELVDKGNKLQRIRDVPVMRYAIDNFRPALIPGEWASRLVETRRGPEIEIYLRPHGPTPDLSGAGIEFSTRSVCVDFGDAAHVELFGIEATRAAGWIEVDPAQFHAVCFRRGSNKQTEGLALTHCRAGETQCSRRGGGAIMMRFITGLTLRHVSVDQARSCFGITILNSQEVDLRYLHLAKTTQSPGRFFTVHGFIFAFSLIEDTGRDAHANKFNFYEGCDRVLVYGIRCRNTGGYTTFQEASRVFYGFCDIDCDPHSQNRALVSQLRPAGAGQGGADGSGDPFAGGHSYYWNLRLLPRPGERDVKRANALVLGPPGSSQRHSLHNSILHGGGFDGIYTKDAPAQQETRTHNRYTGFAWWQKPKYGWSLGAGEVQQSLILRPRGTGRDMRATIAKDIAPLFPTFTDWDLDINGNKVDWRSPPIGPEA